MERYELQRDQHQLSIRMKSPDFQREILETLRSRNDVAWLMLPEAGEEEDSVLLQYNIDGMKSFHEASDSMDNDTFLSTVREMAEKLLSLSRYGLDITQVLTAFDHMMVDGNGLHLVCLCCAEAAGERSNDKKAVIQQLRQVVSGRKGMDDLLGFLANPYCSLQALFSKLENTKSAVKAPESIPEEKAPAEEPVRTAEEAAPEASEAAPEAAETGPVVETEPEVSEPEAAPQESKPAPRPEFSEIVFMGSTPAPVPAAPEPAPQQDSREAAADSPAGAPFKELFEQPAAQAPGGLHTPFIPMNGTETAEMPDRPFVSTIGTGPSPAPKATVPEKPAFAPEPRQAAVPLMPVHSGINDETVVDSAFEIPAARTVGSANEETVIDSGFAIPETRSVTGSANEETVIDSGFVIPETRSVTGSANEETVIDSGFPPAGGARPEKPNRKEEKKVRDKKEKQAPVSEPKPPKRAPVRNIDPKTAFWQSVAILAGILAGAIVLAVVVGAFLGAMGIVLILLAAAIGVTFLFSRGYLTLKWPKKPDEAIVQPVAPDVGDVFNVRLRMISQNLPTHQEVIIRENNQIIGKDPQSCKVPLDYEGISRKHCRISCKIAGGHEEYFITDLGSKNGTQLNGETLEPNTAYQINLGDHVTLAGKYDFKISSDAY